MKPKPTSGRPISGLTKASANLNIRVEPYRLQQWRNAASSSGISLSKAVINAVNNWSERISINGAIQPMNITNPLDKVRHDAMLLLPYLTTKPVNELVWQDVWTIAQDECLEWSDYLLLMAYVAILKTDR